MEGLSAAEKIKHLRLRGKMSMPFLQGSQRYKSSSPLIQG